LIGNGNFTLIFSSASLRNIALKINLSRRREKLTAIKFNFKFSFIVHQIHFIATTIMAGKHGFLGEILLTKDFPHTFRMGKILCIRFAAIVVAECVRYRLHFVLAVGLDGKI